MGRFFETRCRQCGNCDALQLEAARRRACPYPLEVAQPIRCRLIAFYCCYVTLPYAVNLTYDPVALTFDLEHVSYTCGARIKLCTKFERNRAIRAGVTAISIYDLMTLNIYYVLRLSLIHI